jgi:hypothetical protein
MLRAMDMVMVMVMMQLQYPTQTTFIQVQVCAIFCLFVAILLHDPIITSCLPHQRSVLMLSLYEIASARDSRAEIEIGMDQYEQGN